MPKKILIIEDEEFLAEMYKIKFEKEGYQVFISSDGTSGLQIAFKEKPDIILLDILMPGINGFEFLEMLKKNSQMATIPCVLLSNYVQDEAKERAKLLGAVDFWVKADYTPGQILEKVKKILDKEEKKE